MGDHHHPVELMIGEARWQDLVVYFDENPEEAKHIVNPAHGRTMLHLLCSVGACPWYLIKKVAELYPKAITLQEKRYGDTPLHLSCRNSQVTIKKSIGLLESMERYEKQQELERKEPLATPGGVDEQRPHFSRPVGGVLVRNRFGGTPLHSACNHNAAFEVIQALVSADPRIVSVTTHDNIPPIATLYTSYIQTIPGYMAVAKALKGEDQSGAGHFQRFWRKLAFLATCYLGQTRVLDPGRLILHGLLRSGNLQINFYKLPLKHDPSLAKVADEDGNLALHLLVERRPFRLKEREAIESTLQAHPEAVHARNNSGDFPLILAIRNKIPWRNGLDVLVKTGPTTVQKRDPMTDLLPFQLAACEGGNVALDTTYKLLTVQPDLLQI
mmetsp:Transcript_14577/g.34987  ORF Transcript_14577/g.34987 Transcript_14577/m.34987 type:complete len:384 (+) Transcript_14577:104-1255(+)